MLTHLTINNFAIVRHLNIEFMQGMSVITGETGAGKSIAIDAIGLCLGGRAEAGILSDSKQRTEVCAIFDLDSNSLALNWLKEHELQDQNNPTQCLIRRIINADGRSKAFINDSCVSITQLKTIAEYLVNISGQHASQLVLRPDCQLKLLDNYCDNGNLQKEVRNAYQTLKKIQKEISEFRQYHAENEAKKQLLEYQVVELDELNLKQGEFEYLEKKYQQLANSEHLVSISHSILQLLNDDNVNINSMLNQSVRHIENLSQLDSSYINAKNMLQEALIQIQEATSEVRIASSNIEQNPSLLEKIEKRINKTLQIANKHGINTNEIPNLHKKLKSELASFTTCTDRESNLLEQQKLAHEKLSTISKQLSDSRHKGAEKLAKEVTTSIKQLGMQSGEFIIQLDTSLQQINEKGADNVTFFLRSNLGQSPQPLSKIISGGELSRISLAIQVLTANKSSIPTLIFDEVDVGISGATAHIVGKLLRVLSQKSQVICVTHLPQIACFGNQHFCVEKSVVNNKTETQISLLNQGQRQQALAKLLGGTKITNTTLANAQEMLELAS